MWKSSLKTWLIQSSNLNSHDAVLDLFNFCIVLYVRFRYFLEFTFAILGFLLLAKKILENQWGEMCHRYSVFWRGIFTTCSEAFALAPIAFILLFPRHYTHIWLVLWVEIWNLFITTIILVRVFTEKEAGTLCFTLIEIVCDVDEAFKFLLLLPAVLLNTSWDNAMLCSWYKKHLFLEAWLVLRVYRNSNGVKNYWGDFIPMLWTLLLFFLLFFITNSCLFSATSFSVKRFEFIFSCFILPSH